MPLGTGAGRGPQRPVRAGGSAARRRARDPGEDRRTARAGPRVPRRGARGFTRPGPRPTFTQGGGVDAGTEAEVARLRAVARQHQARGEHLEALEALARAWDLLPEAARAGRDGAAVLAGFAGSLAARGDLSTAMTMLAAARRALGAGAAAADADHDAGA
jgi:urease gamma subunit